MNVSADTRILGSYAAGIAEAQSRLFDWLIWASLGAAVVGVAAGLLVRWRIKQLDSRTTEKEEL